MKSALNAFVIFLFVRMCPALSPSTGEVLYNADAGHLVCIEPRTAKCTYWKRSLSIGWWIEERVLAHAAAGEIFTDAIMQGAHKIILLNAIENSLERVRPSGCDD